MKLFKKFFIIAGLSIMGITCFQNVSGKLYAQSESGKLPSRRDIEAKFTWNLADIYASEDQWEKDFNWVNDNLKSTLSLRENWAIQLRNYCLL